LGKDIYKHKYKREYQQTIHTTLDKNNTTQHNKPTKKQLHFPFDANNDLNKPKLLI